MPKHTKPFHHLSAKKRHVIVLIIGFVCLISLTVFLLSPASDFNPDWSEAKIQDYTKTQLEDVMPEIKDIPEKLWILTTQKGNNSTKPVRLVNGMHNPVMYLRPGQTTIIDIVNTSPEELNISIPGYMLHIFSRDGEVLRKIQHVQSSHLAPGQEIQILFTPKSYGKIPVKSLPIQSRSDINEETIFMNIKVQGFPTISKSLPEELLF